MENKIIVVCGTRRTASNFVGFFMSLNEELVMCTRGDFIRKANSFENIKDMFVREGYDKSYSGGDHLLEFKEIRNEKHLELMKNGFNKILFKIDFGENLFNDYLKICETHLIFCIRDLYEKLWSEILFFNIIGRWKDDKNKLVDEFIVNQEKSLQSIESIKAINSIKLHPINVFKKDEQVESKLETISNDIGLHVCDNQRKFLESGYKLAASGGPKELKDNLFEEVKNTLDNDSRISALKDKYNQTWKDYL